MKKLSSSLLLFFPILLFLGGCQTVETDVDSVYRNREHLHNLVWERVNNLYFDPTFNGCNWIECGFDGYEAVMNASTLEQVYEELMKMVNRIENGHTYILSPEQYDELKKSEFVGVGFSGIRHTEQEDLDVVFSVIPNGPADKAGVQAGWIFLNGREIDPKSREVGVANMYRFLDQYGIVHEVSIVCEELPRTTTDWTASKVDENILCLRFDNFNEGLEYWIDEQLKECKDLDAVILDLRWNPGGYKFVLERVLSLFLPANTLIGTTITRHDRSKFVYTPRMINGRVCQKPVVVLTSPFSASSAEILARVLQHYGRGKVIGTGVSAGEVIFSSNWELPGGGLLRVGVRDYLDPDGKRLEGIGVTPDIQLEERSFFEIRRGYDPVMEKAIDYLQKQK